MLLLLVMVMVMTEGVVVMVMRFVYVFSQLNLKLNGNMIETDWLRKDRECLNTLVVINVFKINVLLLFCRLQSLAKFCILSK